MTNKERNEYIEKLKQERIENLNNLTGLIKQREMFIAKKVKENPAKDSFSAEIYEVVKKQAAQKGVIFVK
jgi:hypothetical protein